MFPELDLGFRTVPAYGLLALTGAALGFVVCWLRMRGRRDIRFDVEQALNHYLLLAAGVVIGAKLYSLVLVFPQLIRDLPLLWRAPDVFAVTYLYSGMVFYGGLGGGLLAAWLLIRTGRSDFARMEETFLPSVPLVHAFGRLGCFASGCCYGIEADTPISVVFPAGTPAGGVPRLPVQLFESAGDMAIFLLLCLRLPAWRRPGSRLGCYLALYGLLRFVDEFFRGDAARGVTGTALSVPQFISLGCIAAGAAFLWRAYRRGTVPETAP